MKKTAKKLKTKQWFYAVRGSYLPKSWQGWLLYIPFTAFLVAVSVLAICNEVTVTDRLLAVFPQWVAAAVVMTWVARLKS
jgi:hypothetical protein